MQSQRQRKSGLSVPSQLQRGSQAAAVYGGGALEFLLSLPISLTRSRSNLCVWTSQFFSIDASGGIARFHAELVRDDNVGLGRRWRVGLLNLAGDELAWWTDPRNGSQPDQSLPLKLELKAFNAVAMEQPPMGLLVWQESDHFGVTGTGTGTFHTGTGHLSGWYCTNFAGAVGIDPGDEFSITVP